MNLFISLIISGEDIKTKNNIHLVARVKIPNLECLIYDTREKTIFLKRSETITSSCDAKNEHLTST